MDNKAVGIVLLVLAAGLFFLQDADLPFRIRVRPDDSSRVSIPEACRIPIEAIRAMPIGSKDARELAGFYESFARTIEDDSANLLTNSDAVRLASFACGKQALDGKGIFGKYPGLSAKADEVIASSIGSKRLDDGAFEPVSLDGTKKKDLAQAVRAIAWAVQQ